MKTLELSQLVRLADNLHARVLLKGQLTDTASGSSLESALARPLNQLLYGLIHDPYYYAASCCAAVARGHPFNDGNKRTAFALLCFILRLNDVDTSLPQIETADRVVAMAAGEIDAVAFARWLRGLE